MKISLMALCVWMGILIQTESLEKRVMSTIQQLPASNLDSKLPNRPFVAWFNEIIGQDAGVVWQLAECGAPVSVPGGAGQDMPACAEATVILPNGNRMIVAISVGTFKKGMVGEPAFLRAVVENGEQMYQVRRLHDLPEMLREPRNLPRAMPDIPSGMPQVKLRTSASYFSQVALSLDSAPGALIEEEKAPPPPSPLQRSRKGSGGMIEGTVITRVKPVYPLSARTMNAYGKVDVRVVISESGRVIDATAISGHPALRNAAIDAARQWVYKPATLDGVPVKMESVLTFTFAPGAQ